MDIPMEISVRGLSDNEGRRAQDLVREYAARLEHISRDIIMCRVAVERPQKHQRSGNPYRIRIRVTAPGHTEVVVARETQDNQQHFPLRSVVKDAFRAVERQLEAQLDKRRGNVKRHDFAPDLESGVGFVVRMHREEGYGFLKNTEGREVYFHENSVLHGDFDKLQPGTQVRFEPEMGDDGPQASTVQILDQPGRAPSTGEVEDPQGWVREDS